jgi:hypothetical protein
VVGVDLRRLLILAVALLLALPCAAHAKGGGDDVRVEGTCGRGATSELRLRADDGEIRVEFRLDADRPRQTWRVVLVHERRVAWRGRVRTRSGGDVRVRRTIPDLAGADGVTVRASSRRGATCETSGVLRGD